MEEAFTCLLNCSVSLDCMSPQTHGRNEIFKKSHKDLTIAVWNNCSNNCHVPGEFTRDYWRLLEITGDYRTSDV